MTIYSQPPRAHRLLRILDPGEHEEVRRCLLGDKPSTSVQEVVNMTAKRLYRITEVAEQLNVSRSKVYELLKAGALPSVHIDRTRLVRAEDLDEFVHSLSKAS
jgi:excisionase family DNA binding protein